MDMIRRNMGTFGPAEIACMVTAFKAALLIASDEDSPFAILPALELRRRLARVIITEGGQGNNDADQLKALALRFVAAGLP